MVRVRVNRPARGETMALVTANGRRVSMVMTPSGFNYSNNPKLGQVEREGRKDLTRVTSPGLRSLSFTNRIAATDYTQSIEPILRVLTGIQKEGHRVRFTGGSPVFEQYPWWHIHNLDINVTQRAVNNQPSRAELSWELKEAVDVTADIVKTKPKPRKPPARSKPVGKVTRTHRVVRGDTLWAISGRYLGDPTRYPEIVRMNRNKIKNPNLIYPGEVFKIPAR